MVSTPTPEGLTLDSVLLALGSNIEPLVHLPRALDELGRIGEVRAWSSLYRTVAVGSAGSAAFVNAAVELLTDEPPAELKFDHLRPLEVRLGRRRGRDRNAPRTIDVDIAIYGDVEVVDPEGGVVVPDPEIGEHAHLAVPLAEIAPGRILPGDGRTLAQIAERFAGAPGIRRLEVSPDLWPAGFR